MDMSDSINARCHTETGMLGAIVYYDPFHSREAMMSPDIGQTHEEYNPDSLYNWTGVLYYESTDGETVCFTDCDEVSGLD